MDLRVSVLFADLPHGALGVLVDPWTVVLSTALLFSRSARRAAVRTLLAADHAAALAAGLLALA